MLTLRRPDNAHLLETPVTTLHKWRRRSRGTIQDMLKIMAFLSKRADLATRAFIEHYENNHVPLIGSLAPSPIVYKRNYLVRDHELNRRQDNTIDFDVVTELVFPDRAAYLAWGSAVGTGTAGEQVAADEARFLDRSRTRAYVIEEHVTSG
jgi:hypothetical protein